MSWKKSPCTPPQNLREWYHFVPWTLLSDILHVNIETIGMNSGGGHFQNGRHFKTTFAYISVTDTRRSMILVSIPMFSGSKNSMRAMITILGLAFQNGRQNFKMAAISKTTFAYISVSDTHRRMILVSIPMFSRSKNSMRAMITILDPVFQNGGQNFKMAAT